MKRALFALLGAALLASTGCGIGDRMFSFHRPWGGDQGCGSCGCGNGGCGNGACGNGGCNDPYAQCPSNDPNGGGPQHGQLPRGVGGENIGQEGPPTGGVAYPYYTNRGPRDFLVNNPPSIGP